MRRILNTHKLLQLCFALVLILFSVKGKAQALTISVTPLQCFVNGGPNGAGAFVVTSPAGSASYSWSVLGPCTTTLTPSIPTGSSLVSYYSCCGTYTYICIAYNSGSSTLASTTATVFIACSPTVSAFSNNSVICSGYSATLSATGAQSYTWSTGLSGSQAIVSPTANASYTVQGMNTLGCVDTGVVNITVAPPAFANFTYTYGANGLVTFSNTSYNPMGLNTYTWGFGNGIISTFTSPSITYTSNGTYVVNLTLYSPCGGTSTATQTLVVTSVAGPSCSASFSYLPLGNGMYNFVSTSSGTNSATIYKWYFGNNSTYSATGSAGANPPAQTYPSGTYTVSLAISSFSSLCSDSTSSVINVTVCSLNASFVTAQTGSTTINFLSASTFTSPSTTFTWSYGDNSANGYGISSSHTYTATGIYSVTLTVANNSSVSCTSMQTQTVSVSACNLVSNFTHTVLSNGSVHFSNTSAITSSSTLFKWDFGDGIYSLASNPSHVYSNAGTYYVTLQVRDSLKSYCRDTLTQSINVTGIPCVANSNFTVTPTSTPQYWNAVPSYPWNVTAATWFWGDGTQSNLLYTSHVYSVASTYSICLSVTVSCGASSSYCFPYYINKSNNASSQIVNINVLPPEKGNGIVNLNTDDFLHEIYPNPNTGSFNIHLEGTDKETTITVYNLVGESVYRVKLQSDEGNTTLVNLENAAKGIYFVSLVSGNRSFTQKIIIGD